jgi:hypothetical protein
VRLVIVDHLRQSDRIGMQYQCSKIEGLKKLQIEGIYIEEERFKVMQVEDSTSMRFRS